MNRASPQTRKIAEHLLRVEGATSAAENRVLFSAADKLRPHLANLMGDSGVRALLTRSLVLASAEVPWLAKVRFNAQGHLEGLHADELDPATFSEGQAVMLAHLFGLLVAFIGPTLSTRLIGEIWPQLPLAERTFGNEEDHENGR